MAPVLYKKIILLFLLVVPVCALAYTSVIAKPEDQRAVLPITESNKPQEFFGRLDGFPHTFEFEVQNGYPFKAVLFVPDRAVQKNDVSVIVVKQERRGVTEIKRTLVKEQSWQSGKDRMLVETFRNGGTIEVNLEPGTYTLEVSSPNNEGKYRLVLGTEKIHRGYLANLRTLFEVKELLGNSKFSAIFSPLLYVPLICLVVIVSFFVYRRRKSVTL